MSEEAASAAAGVGAPAASLAPRPAPRVPPAPPPRAYPVTAHERSDPNCKALVLRPPQPVARVMRPPQYIDSLPNARPENYPQNVVRSPNGKRQRPGPQVNPHFPQTGQTSDHRKAMEISPNSIRPIASRYALDVSNPVYAPRNVGDFVNNQESGYGNRNMDLSHPEYNYPVRSAMDVYGVDPAAGLARQARGLARRGAGERRLLPMLPPPPTHHQVLPPSTHHQVPQPQQRIQIQPNDKHHHHQQLQLQQQQQQQQQQLQQQQQQLLQQQQQLHKQQLQQQLHQQQLHQQQKLQQQQHLKQQLHLKQKLQQKQQEELQQQHHLQQHLQQKQQLEYQQQLKLQKDFQQQRETQQHRELQLQQQEQQAATLPGLFGAAPRTVLIRRDPKHGFGFTLRHLVVYPPESLTELYDDGGRHVAAGVLGAPMDTIFVRSVRAGGPAAGAGLRAGDRVLAVNGEAVARASYARLVALAQRETGALRLTVVPRDADVLQRYFSEAAYNPETNQRPQSAAAAMPAPQTAPSWRRARDDSDYASVASLDSGPPSYPSYPLPYPAPYPAHYPSHFSPHIPFSAHDDRRQSDVSFVSTATESKDSLSSFDSASTLTGREIDDSAILSRIRKSLEQKEAFLRRPSQPTGWVTPEGPPPIKQKEFYARPQKLQKPSWPPSSNATSPPPNAASPPPNYKNECDNDEANRKNDNDTESDTFLYGENLVNGIAAAVDSKTKQQKSEKNQFVSTLSKIQETTPSSGESFCSLSNGSATGLDDTTSNSTQDNRYQVPGELQLVESRTRQLSESRAEERTALYRSELARLSTTRPEPSVALRRKEFESKGARREARSLDANATQDHDHDEGELESFSAGNLSGNCLLITGSKHLHCPPPEGYVPEVEKVQMRTRSNSTGSEGLPVRRQNTSDGSHTKRRLGLNREQMEAINRASLREDRFKSTDLKICDNRVSNGFKEAARRNEHGSSNGHGEVISNGAVGKGGMEERKVMNGNERFAENNGGSEGRRPSRPTHLNLSQASPYAASTPSSRASPASPASPTGFSCDDAVTRRQKNAAQIGEEERAMRRVSYLKATWGDRLHHADSDPESDIEPALRSGAVRQRWRPPRFADDIAPLRRIFESDTDPHPPIPPPRAEKKSEEQHATTGSGEEVTMQGNVQVKMVLNNGKRASDRSWKHVWAVLHGQRLFLYRHHTNQSPGGGGGTGGMGTVGGSRETLDLRCSMVDVAGDYTKRKHVVRVTCATGAELLLQADGAPEAARWLRALRKHSTQPEQEEESAGEPGSPAEWAAPPDGLSPLPPQRSKKIGRNRSPTATSTLPSSPKSKTWKGRMARQLRRMHGGGGGGGGPAGGHVAAGSCLGAPLERCLESPDHPGVPLAVAACAGAVETRGLRTVGVYRVPGNAAGVAALAAALDRGEPPDETDPRWADVHVVSSLLKAFLRRLPDSLLTAELYPQFITADRAPDRARALRRLVRALPERHYATLRFLVDHLRRVASESSSNKMEARNLAIVFGPTLVRGADDDVLTMVNDMSSQCRIIESLINHYEWFFEEEEERASPLPEPEPSAHDELAASPANHALLLHNARKIEGKDVSTRDIVSSIISAANRKIQRKPRSKTSSSPGTIANSNAQSTQDARAEKSPPPSAGPHRTQSDTLPHNSTHDRIKRFELETLEMLSRGGAARAAAAQHLSNELSATKHLTNVHTGHTPLSTFAIDGTGDLVSSLTNTFDQKLRTLNNSSPLDDANIPYADDDDALPPAIHAPAPTPPPSTTSKSSISSLDSHPLYATKFTFQTEEEDDSEKENEKPRRDNDKLKPESKEDKDVDEKDVDTKAQNEDEKTLEKLIFSTSYTADNDALRYSNTECPKRNSAVLEDDEKAGETKQETDATAYKLKRSESLIRDFEKSILSCNKVLRSESLKNKSERGSPVRVKLQRSESLNKTDNNNKLRGDSVRRSESLNKADGKLRRSESLTKTEKTESNLMLKRRDLNAGGYRSTKLKRKNGMPERSIKRRHTLGGTKDLDKGNALERRTSSPDLSAPAPPLESHV